MFCPKCGTENTEGAVYCSKCGLSLTAGNPINKQNTEKIPNHLVMAILITLFCCIPFGIVSIIYAVKTDSAKAAGNYELATSYSNKAFNWGIWGLIHGFIACTLACILQFIAIAASDVQV